MRFTTAYHRGGFKEMLETERPITEEAANLLLDSKLYKYYAYDPRLPAYRYILIDQIANWGLPTWIHQYNEEDDIQP